MNLRRKLRVIETEPDDQPVKIESLDKVRDVEETPPTIQAPDFELMPNALAPSTYTHLYKLHEGSLSGQQFYDSTSGKLMRFNGNKWEGHMHLPHEIYPSLLSTYLPEINPEENASSAIQPIPDSSLEEKSNKELSLFAERVRQLQANSITAQVLACIKPKSEVEKQGFPIGSVNTSDSTRSFKELFDDVMKVTRKQQKIGDIVKKEGG